MTQPRRADFHRRHGKSLVLRFHDETGAVVRTMDCQTKAQARNFREMWLSGRLNFAPKTEKGEDCDIQTKP